MQGPELGHLGDNWESLVLDHTKTKHYTLYRDPSVTIGTKDLATYFCCLRVLRNRAVINAKMLDL